MSDSLHPDFIQQFREQQDVMDLDEIVRMAGDAAEAIRTQQELDAAAAKTAEEQLSRMAWGELRAAALAAIPAGLLGSVIWDADEWHQDDFEMWGFWGELNNQANPAGHPANTWEFVLRLPAFAPIKARFEQDINDKWHLDGWMIGWAQAAQKCEDGDNLVHLEQLGKWMLPPGYMWGERPEQIYHKDNLLGALANAKLQRIVHLEHVDEWMEMVGKNAQLRADAAAQAEAGAVRAKALEQLEQATLGDRAQLTPEDELRDALGRVVAIILADKMAAMLGQLLDALEE